MPEEDHNQKNEGKSFFSDGESTPNSIGFWLVIAVIVSVVLTFSHPYQGGAISSLLFLFGPIILIIIAVGKAAEWVGSRHVFDKPGGDRQPLPNGTQPVDPPPPTTQDSAPQDRPE